MSRAVRPVRPPLDPLACQVRTARVLPLPLATGDAGTSGARLNQWRLRP